jgi:hypothetical protein
LWLGVSPELLCRESRPYSRPPKASDVLIVERIFAALAVPVGEIQPGELVSCGSTLAHGGTICSRNAIADRINSTAPRAAERVAEMAFERDDGDVWQPLAEDAAEGGVFAGVVVWEFQWRGRRRDRYRWR